MNKNKGFTILELSVVLAVMGFIASGSLILLFIINEKAKHAETIRKMDYIISSIKQYALEYSRIPCAADPEVKQVDKSHPTASANGITHVFGSGLRDSGVFNTRIDPICYSSPKNVGSTSVLIENTLIGTLPTYIINIPPEYMFDGWGNKFTYASYVNWHKAEDAPASVVGSLFDLPVGSYTAADYSAAITASGSPVINTLDFSTGNPKVVNLGGSDVMIDAAVVLVSHGPNGFRAYPARGGPRKSLPSGLVINSNENENADNDRVFVQGQPVGSTTDSGFDDIVYAIPLWQLRSR